MTMSIMISLGLIFMSIVTITRSIDSIHVLWALLFIACAVIAMLLAVLIAMQDCE